MAHLPVAYVFIDANTALHFRRPDQIDWCALVDANEVVLVGAPILLRELENQKIVNGSGKLRDRAADYVKWLHPFVHNSETEVRAGVRWLFLPDEPEIDFSTERLSLTVADDYLIASVLHYTRQSSAHAFVATADLGLQVKLRARQIRVLELPDDLRLPADLDPLVRENRDLKRQIARIQARMPKLSITFEGGAQYHILSLPDPDAFKVTPLEQAQADNPYMSRPAPVSRSQHEVPATLTDVQRLAQKFGVSVKQVDTYNEELERYFREYQDYLAHHAAWRETVCLHHVIKFVVVNDGTAPASNIDLDVFFPEGTMLVDDIDFPKKPKPPKAPRRPQSILDIRGFEDINYLSSLVPPKPHHMINTNDDGVPIIGESKDWVRVGFSSLKHGFSITSDGLDFRFAGPETVRAFSVDFCLSADELPDAVEGQLHFRVNDAINEDGIDVPG